MYIKGTASAQDVGKLQLQHPVPFFQFPLNNIAPNRFGLAFDGFGGDLKTSQQLQLSATAKETAFAAHRRHHAANTRGALLANHIQFLVTWALSLVATRTEIVGALENHRPQHGQ